MGCIKVEGGSQLRGDVSISGSKNAALAVLPATLLCRDECVIHNVPDIADIHVMLRLITSAGGQCEFNDNTVTINAGHIDNPDLPEELVRSIRASIYMLGALLPRLHKVRMARPGGCNLNRRVNFHIDALTRMGATMEVDESEEWLQAHCHRQRLLGTNIELDPRWRSVGTTVNAMLAAVLAEGVTVIYNAAREPEVVNCARFLKAMGARIDGEGTSTITIEGVHELHGCEFSIINDRIEAGTFLLAGAITYGDVRVGPINPQWLHPVLEKLEQTGVEITTYKDMLRANGYKRPRGASLTTAPYPGFPTDLQPPFVTLLSIAEGRSAVTETIHEGRLRYCEELKRMGAEIYVEEPEVSCDDEVRLPAVAYIEGVDCLHGASVWACDLRAGAALILAGLIADAETVVHNAEVVERGYERFVDKLRALGARVQPYVEASEVYTTHAGHGSRIGN